MESKSPICIKCWPLLFWIMISCKNCSLLIVYFIVLQSVLHQMHVWIGLDFLWQLLWTCLASLRMGSLHLPVIANILHFQKWYLYHSIWKVTENLDTYVQDWTQVLFNQHFIYGRVIWHFHITSHLTELECFGDFLPMRTLCDAFEEFDSHKCSILDISEFGGGCMG